MTDSIIQLDRVSKTYPGVENAVLRDISMAVESGESLAVVGPSGCGKSTLLNLIGALDRPTSGRVLFEGTDLSQLDEQELAAFRNERIGFVFQLHHLLPQCTALENVLIPTLVNPSHRGKQSTVERAEALLARVGLKERMHHRPAALSGGECQRVAVVRALINSPSLLLADEPTGALDEESAEQLGDLLERLNLEEGVTMMVVTHSLTLAGRMKRLLRLRNGQVTGAEAEVRL